MPDTLGDTTLFSQRWMPWACIMGLLALPPAGVARRWRLGAAIAVVASQAIVTSYFWHRFDRLEMSGFRECLAAVPDHSRLLELDFVRFSPTIRMRLGPTFQMAAYAQLDRDVTLGYSFADAPTSLVVFKHGDWPWPWTRMLELRPELLQPGDLDYFDYILLHAHESTRRLIGDRIGRLKAVAGHDSWWLYRVGPHAH